MNLFAFFTPGPMEIVIICVVGVLLFGPKLPKLARSMGAAIPEFKRGLKDVNSELDGVKTELDDVAKKLT